MPLPSTISIPRVNWGKTKERSLMAYIITQDRQLIKKELPVLFGCAFWADVKEPKKFRIDNNNQYQDKSGNWCQVYNESSYMPLPLRTKNGKKPDENHEKEQVKFRNSLYKITEDQVEAEQVRNVEQSDAWTKLTWIVSIVFGSLVIVAGMVYFGGG